MLRFILLLASGSFAVAQQYTISTVAGGAPPATPVAATSASIGQPRRVTLDKAGNVYFSSANSVFKIGSGGVLTLVAGNSRAGFSGDNGPAVNAQLNLPQGLAFDSAGNLYIADSANNRVRIVTPNGLINTFAGTGATSLGGGPGVYNDGGPATNGLLRAPMGVVVDSSNNVYIADTGDNSIRKVTTDGIINTVVGDSFPGFLGDAGNAQNAELHTPTDICLDTNGNLYIADSGNAVIREVTTAGVISTIAGTTAIGFAGDGALATAAALLAPVSVAVDSTGNVYIVENGDSRIRKIDTTKLFINTVVGNGYDTFAGDGSAATNASLNYPTGIALDSSGNMYIADFLNLRIRKVASGNITTIAGNGLLSFSGDGGQALSAQMNGPQGVAADGAGNFYVSDTGNNVVRKVAKGGVISTIAGNGTAGNGGDGGAGTSAQLASPMGLAVDTSGNVYVSDSLNAKVRKISGGVISTVAGNGTPGFGGDGGAGASAQLNTPLGIAVDGAGNLYIADFSNNRVRKVSTGGTITTVAGNGNSGYSGDGGPAINAQLNTPTAVALDGSGNLYIADAGNNVIRVVSPNGSISTIAGNGTAGYSGDGGPALKAQLISPRAIAVDSVGNILIADGSTVIRQVVFPTGNIVTVGGNGTRGYSGDGGLALSAQVNGPTAVALDPTGNLYIADTNNNAVRLLGFAGSGISVGAVVNGASNVAGTVSPGQLVVIYGSGLGPATLTQFQLVNGLVPTSLAGTTVVVNGALAPILYTSATQVAAMVPFSVTGSNALVTVVYQGQAAPPKSVAVAPVSPAIFTANTSGTGPAAALNGGTSVNSAGNPANAGSVVTLYITGAGQTTPVGVDGKPGGDGSSGNPFSLPVLPVTVTIGGKNATVQFVGSAPGVVAGIMQVNVVVPSGLSAGAAPVVVQVGSASSQSGVTIAVSGN